MSSITAKVIALNLFLLFNLMACVPPTDEPEPLTYLSVEIMESVDGETVTDSNGISLSIPEGSTGEGEHVFLEASEAEGNLLDEIEQKYTLNSLFYHFAVRGEKDGVGSVELSFPTDDPNVKIIAIVNGIYCFPLAEEPEEGQISVEALLGPEEASEHPVATLVAGGDVRYALVSPKSEMTAMLTSKSTGLRFQEWANHFSCVDDTHKISLSWLKTASINREVGEAMLREIVKYRGDYATLGFQAAKVTPKIYLRIIINDVFLHPAYAFQTKGMFLPARYVYPFSDRERHAIYHELFHWIEDWKLAVIPEDKNKMNKLSWWLEIAAENGTFLVDPSNIELNAKTFGRRAHASGGPLGVQMSILDWAKQDPARYIQAQLFKVNMCDDHPLCTMSQQAFVDAINNGETPILDVTMCDSDSMNDYARYLLGFTPDLLNDQIPIYPTIANGTAIGDLLWSKRSTRTSNNLSLVAALPNPPRVTVGTNELKVEAKISPCAAYPLRVSNTSTDPESKPILPSWPVALTVEPGARVMFRLHNDEPKEHDGSTPLVLQPISENLGIPVVRVVGLGGESQEVTMKAKVATVDLNGDWVINDYAIESSTMNCNDPSHTITPTLHALKSFTTKMGAVGTFSHTAANKLQYSLDPGKSLSEGTTADFNVELRYDEVKVSAQYLNTTPDHNENCTVQITFKKMEFLGMDDPSDQTLWKLREGRGTTNWTRVIKKVNDQGQSYEVRCSGHTVYKGECEITTVEEDDDDPTTTTTTPTTTTTTTPTTTTAPYIDCTENEDQCWINCSEIEIDAQIAYCDEFDHYSGCALDYVGCGRICLAYSQYWCSIPGYLACLDPVVSDHYSCVENCNAQMVGTPDYGDRMFILYTCGAVCSDDNADGCLCTFETEALNCKNQVCNNYCINQGFDGGHWVYYTPSQGYDACECIEAEE